METAMNRMEKAALENAMAWLQYDRSIKAQNDRLIDKQRRAKADRAAGHSPRCTLAKCADDCPKTSQ